MKPVKNISQQIESLKSRNLIFDDEVLVRQFLLQKNYYRLSQYWRKYQIDPDKGGNNFVDITSFEQIAAIYESDALLRNILQKGMQYLKYVFGQSLLIIWLIPNQMDNYYT